MQHPFGKILPADETGYQPEEPCDSQSRREHLKQVLQLGVGALVVGAAGKATAQITTQALGEEAATTLAIGEEGGRGLTKAGPGHPEHGGIGRLDPMSAARKAAQLLEQKDWPKAARQLDIARKTAGKNKQAQSMIEKLEPALKEQATDALDKADEQAKAGDLVPALDVYRQADRLDPHYGLKERATESIEELSKHELYPVALEKVKKLEEERNKPKPTTRARGEEGGATTKRLGEEGGATTLRVGEEGGGITTQALGEEGGKRPVPQPKVTTFAVGEEG